MRRLKHVSGSYLDVAFSGSVLALGVSGRRFWIHELEFIERVKISD